MSDLQHMVKWVYGPGVEEMNPPVAAHAKETHQFIVYQLLLTDFLF